MRAVGLLAALGLGLAACEGRHVVGLLERCCLDLTRGERVSACQNDETLRADPKSCVCLPELCGAGSPCQTVADCPPPSFKRKCKNATIAQDSLACVDRRCRVVPAPCVADPPRACSRDAECDQVGGCVGCVADLSRACFVAQCRSGTCQTIAPVCGCDDERDCALSGACSQCPDGSSRSCLQSRCVAGQCLVAPDAECPVSASCRRDEECAGAMSCVTCSCGASSCGRTWCAEGHCVSGSPLCPAL